MKNLILLCVFTLLVATNVQAGNEGIKVHGHWQFDIYNKDGSFDRKVEFENALEPAGADVLIRLLIGSNSFNSMQVSATFQPSDRPCTTSSPVCGVSNLTTTTVNSISHPLFFGSVVYQGNFIANLGSGSIIKVGTRIGLCGPEVPLSCGLMISAPFTQKDLSTTPISVEQDQTVNVKVTISFS